MASYAKRNSDNKMRSLSSLASPTSENQISVDLNENIEEKKPEIEFHYIDVEPSKEGLPTAKKVILTQDSVEREIEVSGTAPVFSVLDQMASGDTGRASYNLVHILVIIG